MSGRPWFSGLLKNKHWICNYDYDLDTVINVLKAARELKEMYRRGIRKLSILEGKTLYLIFYNKSLRTRNSFQTGMYQLGGQAIYISPDQVYTPTLPEDMVPYQTEAISDVARVLSRYGNGIAIRIYGDAAKWIIGRGNRVVREFAKWSSVPVLNMEDDVWHPFQALADAMALLEALGWPNDLRGKKIVVSYAYSGGLKPLAVPQDVASMFAMLGADVYLAHPPGFELMDEAINIIKRYTEYWGSEFKIVNNMDEAFENALMVYPKAWSPKRFFPPFNSVVDKDGAKAYQDKFRDWIVTRERLEKAGKPYYMHCGPADRGQEVTDYVLDYYEKSLYFEEAENRLHVQKAVMAMTMGD
uniref:Ornithine carbamoyltransferase n=1 Tax=Staphylothermus marinus TaxID=2280 RepID=A0A7C4D819_STAMA